MKSLAEKLHLKPGYEVIMKGAGMEDFPDFQPFLFLEAKKPETRQRRLAQLAEKLLTGEKQNQPKS